MKTRSSNLDLLGLTGAFALGLLALVSCAAPRTTSGGFEPADPSRLVALADVELRLTRLVVGGEELALPEGRPLTARLAAKGQIAGRSAVNQYSGTFVLDAHGALHWPGGFVMTRMAGPPEAMELEDRFLAALSAATELLTSTSGARFQNADATTILEFTR